MRSATSYFNGTLYRKTLARFWPLWGLYGLIWLFSIPLNMLREYFNRYQSSAPGPRLFRHAVHLPEFATIGLYLAFFFAILCAMAVFGYLYNSRSACWFHALPMRREALFTTQYLAGLSFLLLPQLAVAGLTAMIEMAFLPMGQWAQALSALLAWLLAQSGICLFFFSFAAFCAMFTGHILALPAFYGILNILVEVIYSLIDGLMYEFFFGYTGASGAQTVVEYLTPCVALKDALILFGNNVTGWYYRSSVTVAAYAGVGVLLALACLYVYRRRHAETAGDVVAIPLVRPLFKYGVSFCAGLCLGIFTSAFFGWNTMSILVPLILIWSVAGYFAAEMLLKKSFRVFKAWKGAVIMPAVLLVLCLACMADLFGVERRIPGVDRVENLSVTLHMGYPSDNGQSLAVTLTDPENIQKFIDLHQAIVDDWNRNSGEVLQHYKGTDDGSWYAQDYTYLQLNYTLKGGSTLSRRYNNISLYMEDMTKEDSVTNLVKQLCEDRELVAQAYDFQGFLEGGRLTGAWLDRLNNAEGEWEYNVYVDDYAQELWDAVQADFAEGTIGVRYLFDMDPARRANTSPTDLSFSVTVYQHPDSDQEGYSVQISPGGYNIDNTLTITLTPNARHTLAVLDKTGLWEEGYSLAENELDYTPEYPETENW